ncbi:MULTISPECIES: hypothetical protein [unclassified Lentimonas]|uniref:hypothetical protein n=1 Tax=unclassified Lentimonas TaxID=2630993 RepID=UPI00132BBD28|nr:MULTISPECIES: hypothetical protein [unclassified Lentimonas]CAA6693486.1 Unannotated [Lentimonas sp. CC19]CAA6695830.1 Unannotated [Lentimonas sp. CC10]CAA7069750.1 Unannotated [Lentimonas sp. CC11]
MKLLHLKILFFLTLNQLLLADFIESKLWTNIDGRSFTGTFVSSDLDDVRIRKDGTEHSISVKNLIEDDQSYIFKKLGYETYAIGNMAGGAFAGKVKCLWKQEGSKLRIYALDWKVRFRCHDQAGRELKNVYLWLGNNEHSKSWGTRIKSKRININRDIARGEISDLSGLSFELELNDVEMSDYHFLVTTYESGEEKMGFNFDMPEQYLSTGKPLTFSHLD